MLQIRDVVSGDQRDLVVAVQVPDLGQEFLNLAGFLYADAVGQIGHRAAVNRVHTDEFGRVGVL